MIDLKAQALLDDRPYNATLGKMKTAAKVFSRDVQAPGGKGKEGGAFGGWLPAATAVGTAVTLIGRVAQAAFASAREMKQNAEATGLNVDEYNRLHEVARQHGRDSQEVVTAMSKIRKSQADVINGNKVAIDSWSKLGLSQQQVAAASPLELLRALSASFKESAGGAEEYGAASRILGEETLPKLAATLKDVAAGAMESRQSMSALGAVSVAVAEKAGADWDAFWTRWKQNFVIGAAGLWSLVTRGTTAPLFEQAQAQLDDQARSAQLARERNIAAYEERRVMERAKIDKGIADITERARPGAIISDSLAKSGGMIGGQANPSLRNEQRMISIQEEIKKYLSKIAENTKDNVAKAG